MSRIRVIVRKPEEPEPEYILALHGFDSDEVTGFYSALRVEIPETRPSFKNPGPGIIHAVALQEILLNLSPWLYSAAVAVAGEAGKQAIKKVTNRLIRIVGNIFRHSVDAGSAEPKYIKIYGPDERMVAEIELEPVPRKSLPRKRKPRK